MAGDADREPEDRVGGAFVGVAELPSVPSSAQAGGRAPPTVRASLAVTREENEQLRARVAELQEERGGGTPVALAYLMELESADEIVGAMETLLGHLCQKFGVKDDAKTGTMALPKKKAKRSSTKTVQQTGKLGEVVSQAFGEFRELAEDPRGGR
jgi:hypothetical protein